MTTTETIIRKQLEARKEKLRAKLEPLQKEYNCTVALLATLDEQEKSNATPQSAADLPDMLKVRR